MLIVMGFESLGFRVQCFQRFGLILQWFRIWNSPSGYKSPNST